MSRRRCRWDDPETAWGEGNRGSLILSWLLRAGVAVVMLVLLGLLALLLWPGEKKAPHQAPPNELQAGMKAAEAVARSFLKETDPAKRLQWVRNADEVKERLMEYPEEARSEAGGIEKVLGHQMDGGRSVTGFVVEFSSGNLRLLEVVGTVEGPRVDWDAYARYGSASWEDLWSGEAKRAVVRVFCEPSTERPEPFEDQGKWTCFRMSSPDLPQAVLGFTEAGSVRDVMMKRVILGTPNYRQRFTLEVVRHAGRDEPHFEITRCLAVGWVTSDPAVEEIWEKSHGE
jgi:hypothetical protein